MKHMGSGRQRETHASSFGTQHEYVKASVVVEMPLKPIDDCLPLRNGRVAVYEINARQSELRARKRYCICRCSRKIRHRSPFDRIPFKTSKAA
jgi:hypothetical protein